MVSLSLVEQKYEELSRAPSDINEHMVVLRYYAYRSQHVTELGVRRGVSTWAFLSGGARTVVSVDVNRPEEYGGSLQQMYDAAHQAKVSFRFILANDLSIELEPTDLLFIDTLHTYTQLSQELKLHAAKARKYIIMHDTVTYGKRGADGGPGLQRAIDEFLAKHHPEWHIKDIYTNNNGLTVLAHV